MAPGRGGRSGGAAGGANAPPRPAAARQRRHSHGCAPSAPIGIIRAGGCPKHRRWVAFGAFGGGEGERAGGRPAVCPSYSPPPAPAPASVGCLPPTTRASSPSVSAAYLHRRGHRCCGGSCDSFVLHVWSQRLATRQTGTPNRHIWGGGSQSGRVAVDVINIWMATSCPAATDQRKLQPHNEISSPAKSPRRSKKLDRGEVLACMQRCSL